MFVQQSTYANLLPVQAFKRRDQDACLQHARINADIYNPFQPRDSHARYIKLVLGILNAPAPRNFGGALVRDELW